MTSNEFDSASGEKEAMQPAEGARKRRMALGLRIVILIFLLVLLAAPVLVPILIGQNASDDTATTSKPIATGTNGANIPTTLPNIVTTTAATILTTSTTAHPYACGAMTVLIFADLSGNDLDSRPSYTYSQCCSWCSGHSRCASFTWNRILNDCFLKSATSTPSYHTSGISAFK